MRKVFPFVTILSGLLLLGGECFAAQPLAPQVELVAKLYKEFAYEAVLDKPAIATGFINSPRKVLLSYLTPSLAELMLKDRKCATDSNEICKLDFMPLWGSQDAAGAVVQVSSMSATSKVKVQLRHGSESRSFTYSLMLTKRGWRIDDIVYDEGHASLVQILAPMK